MTRRDFERPPPERLKKRVLALHYEMIGALLLHHSTVDPRKMDLPPVSNFGWGDEDAQAIHRTIDILESCVDWAQFEADITGIYEDMQREGERRREELQVL